MHKRNLTGLQGVHRYEHQPRKDAISYARWTATWVDQSGKIRSKTFSVKKFGEEGAREKAIAYRLSLGKPV